MKGGERKSRIQGVQCRVIAYGQTFLEQGIKWSSGGKGRFELFAVTFAPLTSERSKALTL